MSIATKTGDDGTTALMFGRRVPKTDARIEACGSVDELNASLGMARALLGDSFVGEQILSTQQELVTLMGELGIAEEDRSRYLEKGYRLVTDEMVDRLTGLVDDLETNHAIRLDHWATPGANPVSAALDVARTTCRRAERRVLEISPPNPAIIHYLNRLSDLCWLWARYGEKEKSGE